MSAPPADNPRLSRLALPACAVALLTLAAFWPAVHGQFVAFDDGTNIVGNPHVTGGLSRENIAWAFSNLLAGYWVPLHWLSLMLDATLFGPGPWGFHFTNLLLHAVNAGLLFLFLARATGCAWRAAIAAGLFALHPLRVESFAWATERKDVLSMTLGFLALNVYVCHTCRPGAGRFAAMLAFWLLSLLAKPTLVTFPALLLLLDTWPLRRDAKDGTSTAMIASMSLPGRRAWLEKLAMMPAVLLVAGIAIFGQGKLGALPDADRFSLGTRVTNALVAYVEYPTMMLRFDRLAVFYPHPGRPAHWAWAGAAAVLLAVTAAAFSQRRRRPWLLVGWLWYLGTLVPMIGLIQVSEFSMADRFTYLPTIGLLLMLAWSIPDAWASPRRRPALAIASAAAMLTLAFFARRQIATWRDSEALFTHAIAVTQRNHFAHNNLGVTYAEEGRSIEAIEQFRLALAARPEDPMALGNLGVELARMGSRDEAIDLLTRAAALQRDNPRTRFNLALQLARAGRDAEAIEHYRRAIELDPNMLPARVNLAAALARGGRLREAGEQLDAALRIEPDNEGLIRSRDAIRRGLEAGVAGR